MKRTGALWIGLALSALFVWGSLRLLGLRIDSGDIYPEYSSLRTDALGSKLLFDSLTRIPGLSVARNYFPLDLLTGSPSTVLVVGTPVSSLTGDFLERVTQAARRGNRVVMALATPKVPTSEFGALEPRWQVTAELDINQAHSRRLYFKSAPGWKVVEQAGAKLLVLERAFDKGTIVLRADSFAFANESMIMGEGMASVTAAIGSNPHIVFDEEHLGIAESGSVMGLARRYRLLGFALGLAICAALALWKNASPFPLRGDERKTERVMARTSSAGLATLLGRHIPPGELAAACWQEWLKSNRQQVTAERVERAAGLVRSAKDSGPLAAVRDIQAVVRAKGAL